LFEGRAEGLQVEIGFRDDVKGQLVVLKVPGDAGRPGSEFIVPPTLNALEVIISQPLDACGLKFLGCLTA
jgi:hypothetical protein